MKKLNLSIAAFVLIAVLLSFNTFRRVPAAGKTKVDTAAHKIDKITADKIFINGKIITIDSSNTIAQALAVKDGRILAVGTTDQINALKGAQTVVIDLAGKTLLPGFVDGHSHFMSLGRSNYANVASPPMGTVTDIAGIIAELQKFKKDHNIKNGEWITGYGYDQDQLAEKRHPEKEDLDAAFPNNPVIITNINGHMVVVNSAALKVSGIDSTTKSPAGGAIVHRPGTNEPTGLLQEGASRLLKRGGGQRPSEEKSLEELQDQENYYAGFGVTTAQEGYTSFESVTLLKKAAEKHELFIDIAALPAYSILDKLIGNPAYSFGAYDNHLKLEGFKMISDGSPQGKDGILHPALPYPGSGLR